MTRKVWPPPAKNKRGFDGQLEELEARILYNADLNGLLPEAAWDSSGNAPAAQIALMPATPTAVSQRDDSTKEATSSVELVFIDASVPDADELLALLSRQTDPNRTLEVHWLDGQTNGIDQITEVLRGREGIDAVHIISHGDGSGLDLGSSRLDGDWLNAHMGDLASWGSALSPDADLLLYGCDLASTSEGRALVDNLSLLTGSDVAASDDLTGSTLLGGDWVLEYQVGEVDSAVVFEAQALSSWNHVLATITFQEGVSSYTGTQDTYIDTANASTNYGASGSMKVDDGTPNDMQTLIRFDNIIGAGQIPAGSTITSATLTVYVTNHDAGDSVNIHEMLINWTEASTYSSLGSGVATNNVEASSTGLHSLDAGTSGAVDFTGLAASVQAWANGGTNYGWVIVTGASSADDWTIVSSEGATAGQRPKLTVTYTPPTPPSLDLDANNSSGGTGSNFSGAFTEQTAAYIVDTADATVTAGVNTISTNLSGMTVTLTNPLDGALESLSATTTGTSIVASYNGGTGVLTLSGSDTAAHYQTVLRTIQYNNTSDNPTTTSRSITIIATDPYGGNSATATSTLTVTRVNDAPVISSNGSGSSASVSIAENGTAVTTATASDAEGASLTYSISGGADAAKFSINSATGVLVFLIAPDFEVPTDSGGNNVYDLVVMVSDGTASDTQSIAVTITNVNDNTPVITSNAGGASASINVAENSTAVTTVVATDADAGSTLTYSISGGADSAKFSINASTGVLIFLAAPNRESATDSGADNVYDVIVQVSDGATTDTQNLAVTVTDVDEFDVTAVSDANAAANSVAENATNGTTVGITASASDADNTTNTITYSLSDSAGGRFTINASTGVVTVADGTLLNYESATSHAITVVATSADGSSSNQAMTVNLTDVDEFDVGTISDANASANSVAENVANGTVVGITASASDADGTTNTITYSLSDDAGGRFTINASTGVVTVANGTLLNYESATSHAITVVATSADGSSSNQVMTINLTDVDEFDVGAVSDANAGANSVAENAANGTTVGITASAADADGTTNTITYTLSDSAGGRFTINASTGVVTVANGTLLNYESATSHSITVVATSADGSSSNQVMTVNLTDVDEFDVGAVSDVNATTNSVAENVANGTVVGITANATDADATTNAITYSLSDDAGGRFTINASTGVVTVANGTLLNYEAATSHAITVVATSADGSSSNQVMTINLSDVDEFDVGAVSDVNAGANSVAENVANGTVVGITANATDADGTTNTITYSLSDDAGGRFTINASTGVVTVANGTLLNYESATSHAITVVATSADGSSSNQVMTVNLTDVDEFDVGAVSDVNAGANSVAENVANGTVVGITASATDADGTTNTITYSLSDDAGGRFTINASTGVVTVADGTLLNYESATSHAITVVATSADGSSSNQVMTINLSDVDEFDVGAVSDVNAGANSVAENVANGTVVGITANASDADGTTNTITYSLSDDAGGRFTINASTGVVTVANGTLLNYEASTSHAITVVATSADGSSSNQVMTINLSDVDEFDVGAVSDVNAGANSVAENVANGTVVGITANATDADGTTNTITYSLSDDAGGRFTINASTGVVTVANGTLLNYEAATSHAITVVATSADGSSSNQVMTINLTDVDEFDVGAVSDVNAAANSVAENAANGTVVGITANATDADGTTNTITYSLSDDAGGRFTINASTGVVTVANGTLLNYEAATSHAITVVATSADGSSSNQVMTINLSDANEFSVGSVSDSNASTNEVLENAVNGTLVGVSAHATDADGTTNTIAYSLSDDAGGRFTINASTGVVTVANGTLLDYESATSHVITVVATSADGSSSNQAITINLLDGNEFPVTAVLDADPSSNTVVENATNGTVVGVTANATDADGDAITYSLSDDAGGRFTINASTGVVTVADGTLLNYEAATSHAITVVATSADGSSSNQVMTINLSDANEFAVGAVSDTNAGANSVAENAANGTVVGVTANATDADGTTNTITYSLSDDAGGRFTINASTGVVTVANGTLLNYEAATSHAITVVATSVDGSSSNQVMTVNLTDVDEFDVGAVSDANAGANSVAENVANGTVVGITASATDADGTTNTITYSLSDDAGGRFTINASTGVVTVANGTLLNYEAATSHAITVVATSADGSSSNQVMTVNLTDVDEFDVGAVSDVNAGANSVAENVANGTVVGITASATDADGTTNTITYSLSDDAGGRFAINASTGVVTVANGTLLNYESTTSHAITVVATSADGSSSNQVMTVNLTDVDEFDVGAVSDVNAGANSVAENVANGTVVGITASASDADGTTNTITYSLSDDAGGRFTINASTGVVTVANGTLLNYESATSHAITVVATSADGSSSNQVMTINLTDVDEFDVGAVSDVNAGANSVAENVANGTVVGITASATDADGTTNTITYSLSDDAGGRFTINASTGVVTVANGTLLNYESATSHAITVVATSADGSSSNQVMTVNLTDVDEFDVGAVSDVNAGANSVAENVANGTVVGITASASDADGTTNTITYSLSDDAGGRFTINASTGVVTVANGILLNYESATSHAITVVATSADGSSSNQVMTINLSDVDEFDVGAVSDVNAGANSVAENVANGTVVGITASATDADGTTNTITYSLSDDAGGRFTINASTGVVTVANGTLLNYESATSHTITVLATSADGSSSNQVMVINLSDVNESSVGAVSDTNAAANSVAENAANGTVVGITANATDADSTTSTITYSLSNDAGGRFTINASTGVVTVANSTLLNYESATSHAITVVATSADGSSSNQVMTVNLSDVNEFAVGAVSDTNAAANSVAENATNGTVVGITGHATDADTTTNTIVYSLSDDAGGRFTINASTGVVTVANGTLLNYEVAASHTITVVATSADGSSSSQSMTVNLSDVNEFAIGAVGDANAGANNVAENAANGTVVGVTANATDADGTTNTITYSLSDDAGGRFTVNASTGVVTVANGGLLDFETTTSHSITVLATSADGSSSSQSFTVSLSPVNDNAPVITSGGGGSATTSMTENATSVGLITAVDADAGSTLSYSIAGGLDASLFSVNSVTGALSFTAAPDRETPADSGGNNVYDVILQVSDGTLVGTQAIAVTVLNGNDAPLMAASHLQVSAQPTVSWVANDLVSAFTDQDGDALSLVMVGPASHGTVTVLLDGSVRYEAAAGFSGNDQFSYTVSDGQAQGTVRFVDITVAQADTPDVVVGTTPDNVGEPTRPEVTPDPPEPEAPETPPTEPATASPEPTDTVPTTPISEEGPLEVTPTAAGNGQVVAGSGQGNSPTTVASGGSSGFAFRLDAGNLDLSVSPGHALFKMLEGMQVDMVPSQGFNLSLSTVAVHGDAHAAPLAFADTPYDQVVKVQKTVMQTSGAVMSVGAVWWAARMSGLLASLMISTPAWRSLDPLPVMGLGEDRDPEDEFDDDDATPHGQRHMDEKAAGLFAAKALPVAQSLENIG